MGLLYSHYEANPITNNNLKINAVSGTLCKTFRKSYFVRFQQGRRPRIFYPRKFHFRKRAYFKAVFMCNLPDYERQKKQGLYHGRERVCIPTLKMKMKWKEIVNRILAN